MFEDKVPKKSIISCRWRSCDRSQRIVRECLAPLYERFDGLEATPDFIAAQIAEFRRSGFER